MDILIYSIEDDINISKIINKTLSNQGYIVKSFYDGESFFEEFNKKKPHMILLDMMLPDISGSEILKRIRSNPINDEIDIIIISANHMVMDKVDGLDLGADDYIEKPFDILELISRVNAHLRRYKKTSVYSTEDLTLDTLKHVCTYKGEKIQLTIKEFQIVEILLKKKGSVVSRDELLAHIWDENEAYQSRTIDMHIRSIRKKTSEELIQTVYGVGYQLN